MDVSGWEGLSCNDVSVHNPPRDLPHDTNSGILRPRAADKGGIAC